MLAGANTLGAASLCRIAGHNNAPVVSGEMLRKEKGKAGGENVFSVHLLSCWASGLEYIKLLTPSTDYIQGEYTEK